MRLHILFLLTSTVAFNVPRHGGGALRSMPKRGGAAHNNKKHAKQPRHVPTKPLEPAGGWPDDGKVLAELEEKSQSTFGKRLRDVVLRMTSSPGTWPKVKREKCTGPMAKMCAAYVMVMCFGDEMVDTSIHCALVVARGRSSPGGSAAVGSLVW